MRVPSGPIEHSWRGNCCIRWQVRKIELEDNILLRVNHQQIVTDQDPKVTLGPHHQILIRHRLGNDAALNSRRIVSLCRDLAAA